MTDFDALRDICPYCDRRFEDEYKVAQHVRNSHKKPFKCDLCRRQYFNQEVLARHRKTHNTDSHFECSICHLKYKREETLQCHYVRVHSDIEASFMCDHCGKKYKLKQDLLLHINQVHMCSYQICRFCGKAVKNVKAHEWHHQQKLEHVKKEAMYPCSLCFKKFRSESKLENHLMRHVQRYNCSTCGENFPGPGQLMNHKSKHRPGVTCSICDKFFASRSNYYQHVLMHAKVRPYKCDVCHECFTQRSTLVRHRKTHPGPMPKEMKVVPIANLARKVLENWS